MRLCTIPGVDRVTAWGLLAEIGLDMKQFPDVRHWGSWAGLCPGSRESAGKRKSGKIRKGSLWLRRCLCQAAWAVSTKKNNYLSALNAFEVSIADGKVLKEYGQLQAKQVFARTLAIELQNADDDCITKACDPWANVTPSKN